MIYYSSIFMDTSYVITISLFGFVVALTFVSFRMAKEKRTKYYILFIGQTLALMVADWRFIFLSLGSLLISYILVKFGLLDKLYEISNTPKT